MYGLIIENFSCYLKHKYGDEAWEQVRNLANLDSPTFSIHQVSTENTSYNVKDPSIVEGGTFYAQLRGFLTDQYCEKSAVITWLLPTTNSPPPDEVRSVWFIWDRHWGMIMMVKHSSACKWLARGLVKFISALARFLCVPAWVVLHTIPRLQSALSNRGRNEKA